MKTETLTLEQAVEQEFDAPLPKRRHIFIPAGNLHALCGWGPYTGVRVPHIPGDPGYCAACALLFEMREAP